MRLLIGDLPSFYLEWLRGLRWRKASLGVSLACEHRGDAHWPSTPLSEGMPARVCIIWDGEGGKNKYDEKRLTETVVSGEEETEGVGMRRGTERLTV